MSETDNLDDLEQGAEGDFSDDANTPLPKPAKKKSTGFMIFVVLLLLVGGGLVAAPYFGIPLPFYLPGMGPVAKAPPVPATADAPAPAKTAEIAPDPLMPPPEGAMPVDSASAPAGFNDLYEARQDEMAAPPMPVSPGNSAMPDAIAPMNASDPLAAAPVESEAVLSPDASSDPLAEPPALAEAPPMPAGTDMALPMEAEETGIVDAPVVEPAPAPVSADPAAQEAVAALERKVVELESALADVRENAVSKRDLEEIKESLANLEKSMMSRKSAAALKAAKREVDDYRNGIMPGVVAAEPAVSEPSPSASAAKKRASGKAHTWVLKSAKPGMAWVAETGSNELKTVTVGETLDGIGKITAIVKDSSGHWVVSGTKGILAQ